MAKTHSTADPKTPKSTPFGARRAREIWARRGTQNALPKADCITDGEDAYVHKLWRRLPKSASWMTAFYTILNGPEEPSDAEEMSVGPMKYWG